VLGIWGTPFGETMCLTAIEDILDVKGSADKVIVLKKYDLQGVFINTHELCLSEIFRIRRFKKKYRDAIALFDRLDVLQSEHDHLVKIKRIEQNVSVHELRIILIRIINSGYRIAINLLNDAQVFAESCSVISFESGPHDVIIASCEISGNHPRAVLVDEIESIEFDFFYSYKGLSSKVFRVTR
jgi:hypothetical protein